jgi:hypothetical protein
MKKPTIILAVLLAVSYSSISLAGVLRDDKSDSDWEILLTPYLWGTSLDGTSAFGMLPPLDIDASFGDILDNLNMALSLHTEFHRGDWAFVIDPMYVSLEINLSTPLPDVSPKIEVDMLLVEVWTAYKINSNWELLGGLRWQDQEIDVSGLPDPFPVAGFSVADDWLNWFAGARFRSKIGQNWIMALRADVVFAGDSDSSYNVEIFFNRRFGKSMALNLGYRYFVDDYDNLPTYAWDMTQEGPVIGYTWSF